MKYFEKVIEKAVKNYTGTIFVAMFGMMFAIMATLGDSVDNFFLKVIGTVGSVICISLLLAALTYKVSDIISEMVIQKLKNNYLLSPVEDIPLNKLPEYEDVYGGPYDVEYAEDDECSEEELEEVNITGSPSEDNIDDVEDPEKDEAETTEETAEEKADEITKETKQEDKDE